MLISDFIRDGRALFAQCDLSNFPQDLVHTALFGKIKCSNCGNREVLAIPQTKRQMRQGRGR